MITQTFLLAFAEARKSLHLLAGVGRKLSAHYLPQHKNQSTLAKETTMPAPDRASMKHEHDGLELHYKNLSHESRGPKDDKNHHLRGVQFAHGNNNSAIKERQETHNGKVTVPETNHDKGIFFPLHKDWHENAYGRASDNIKEYISILLRKSELQIAIADHQNNERKDSQSLAEVNRILAQTEIPL